MLAECGDPGKLENGQRLVTGTQEGATVEYNCEQGFVLHGVTQRSCTSTGEWTESVPSCVSKFNLNIIHTEVITA